MLSLSKHLIFCILERRPFDCDQGDRTKRKQEYVLTRPHTAKKNHELLDFAQYMLYICT